MSGMFALLMTFALLSSTALAYNDKDVPVNVRDTERSTGIASVAATISLTINGVTYSIPGGSSCMVGDNCTNNSTYVRYCQMACNRIDDLHKNDTISWSCSCGTVDGVFGPNTRKGIKMFQQGNNLRSIPTGWPILLEDGICGDNTWKQLAVVSR